MCIINAMVSFALIKLTLNSPKILIFMLIGLTRGCDQLNIVT